MEQEEEINVFKAFTSWVSQYVYHLVDTSPLDSMNCFDLMQSPGEYLATKSFEKFGNFQTTFFFNKTVFFVFFIALIVVAKVVSSVLSGRYAML